MIEVGKEVLFIIIEIEGNWNIYFVVNKLVVWFLYINMFVYEVFVSYRGEMINTLNFVFGKYVKISYVENNGIIVFVLLGCVF